MKSFYFSKGKTISKESFESMLEDNKTIEGLFFYNGKILAVNSQKNIDFEIPTVYSNDEQTCIEMPSFYEIYSLSFLNTAEGKKLRITTIYGSKIYDLSIKNDPIEMSVINGIINFR